MTFSPTIIINTTPSLTISVAGISYNQLLNSLGTQVYRLDKFYMYSSVFNQLISTINYNKYDSDGNKIITNINTVVNPFNGSSQAINVDLSNFFTPVIFNGNSSISTSILPNNYVQLQLNASRITNAGEDNPNFNSIKTGVFFDNQNQVDTTITDSLPIESKNPPTPLKKQSTSNDILLLILASATAFYIISKSK